MFVLFEFAIIIFLLIIFSYITYSKKSLNFNGVLLASVVGISTYLLGGITSFFVIVIFFVVAEFCTKCARLIEGSKQHEVRNIGNILGNSGAALIALALMPGPVNLIFFASMAAALADTLSSEIGLMSKKKPFLITTLKEVKPGTDGGVTLLGLAAAIIGAFLISLIFYALTNNPLTILIVTFSGFMGSIVDSVLGATLERKKILNNATVNFLASLFGGILAGILALLCGCA